MDFIIDYLYIYCIDILSLLDAINVHIYSILIKQYKLIYNCNIVIIMNCCGHKLYDHNI